MLCYNLCTFPLYNSCFTLKACSFLGFRCLVSVRRFPRPSRSTHFGDLSEANGHIFAWTTWPETSWPRGIMIWGLGLGKSSSRRPLRSMCVGTRRCSGKRAGNQSAEQKSILLSVCCCSPGTVGAVISIGLSAWMLELGNKFEERKQDCIVSPEVRASAWLDSGRTSFSPPRSKRQKEALLTGWILFDHYTFLGNSPPTPL